MAKAATRQDGSKEGSAIGSQSQAGGSSSSTSTAVSTADNEKVREVLGQTFSKDDPNPSRKMLISPLKINFSQTHIRPDFQDGGVVDELAEQLGSKSMPPLVAKGLDGFEDFGAPASDTEWLLLKHPFPEIEVILWRIKLREEDGNLKVDAEGNELYGEPEWYTLDNRRLYCLQRAAAALYPKEVRCIVNVLQQEDGNCREFRKFRTPCQGRSIRIGHRDSQDLPRWCWREKVGLPEEILPEGTAVARQPNRRRGSGQRSGPNSGRNYRYQIEDDEDDAKRSNWDMVSNAALFVVVYAGLRLAFAIARQVWSSKGRTVTEAALGS
eukprot:TRINITY_DN4557_c0_g1_i1.p1 TRINITY_DN4557_c0_g1~~TRINITY_DN4557_c0_g1_i1.p1  ORF type:complete len:325 (-),score=67.13 TRINITY_DN4557_c0_g1_i1:181-1155(-)